MSGAVTTNYVQTVVAALAGGRLPEVMSMDTFKDIAGLVAKGQVGEGGDWEQVVDQTMAAFATLDQGDLDRVRWFATGFLTGLMLDRHRGGRAT
jgi:hypothetical protein